MSELGDLYQQLILDHNAKPRNFGALDEPTHSADGHNPLCGDSITLQLRVQEGIIQDVRFTGSGCAISKASTSLMTAALKGMTIEEANKLFDIFHRLVTGEGEAEVDLEKLGKLAAFSGVREYPARVKCASLAWHTFRAALEGSHQPASTE